MARYWQQGDPVQQAAGCNRTQAELLVQFDHHQVVVNGIWGILITYPWMPLETAPEPLVAVVVLNPAPRHLPAEHQVRNAIRKHPLAPQHVQALVDELVFTPLQE
jgi:hypothetical protein